MLSMSAFNALLKIIEEPPEHLLFILATTELHKVPATILSRCQRFSFRRISQEDIAARLQYVAYQEQIDLDDSAARVLARLADGGMRDGLSLLDQCASATTGELTADRVYACLGIAGVQECGKLMACIAEHDSGGALALMNRYYAEGKDMGALLDEMACLTRDFMIMHTAPAEGISMLSGVASDEEVKALASRFSTGELTRMMGLIQQTAAGFTKSAARRMDVELCLLNLCQPELSLDVAAMNARLTRMEDQIKTGAFTVQSASAVKQVEEDERPPMPTDEDAPPEGPDESVASVVATDEAPMGFWVDVAAQVRSELKPPVSSFFAATANTPVQGVLQGDRLLLVCANQFAMDIVNKPDILALVSRKASARLGHPIKAVAIDKNARKETNTQMEKLLTFGREHSDIVNIK